MVHDSQSMPPRRPAHILMVDDNPGDARLMLEAMKEVGLAHQFHWLDDGEKAMTYLRHPAHPATAPRPDLIFLDLNMPRKDGREILAEIKSDAALKHIPVIILTTSRAEEDMIAKLGELKVSMNH
jgi:CheY-like chemotaxis protein